MALAKTLPFVVAVLCTHAAIAATGVIPQIEVVSRPYTNIAHVFGDSSGLLLSADGKWAAFNSTGNGLATNDNNGGALDVFLKNLTTGEARLVSRDLNRASASGDSLLTGLSADGRFVLFESTAPDFALTDSNGASDVFLYDRDTDVASVISASPNGTFAGDSGAASITRNGRFVLFESTADGIVPQDQNRATDLFLLDRQSGDLKLVTWNAQNTASAASDFPLTVNGLLGGVVSEDGHYVAFLSSGRDLGGPTNGSSQIYLRDMIAGKTLWLSRNATNGGGDSISHPQLSTNGEVIAFLSSSVASGQISQWLHLYSVTSNLLSEVPAPTGTTAGATIDEFALSANGQKVAYILNGSLYAYDLVSGTTTPVWNQPGALASQPVFSDDAKMLIFLAVADSTTIVSPYQLYGYDGAQVRLLTPNLTKTGGLDHDALFPVLSADGTTAGFMSYAQNAVTNDDKNQNDVFVVATSGAEAPQLVSVPLSSSTSSTGNNASDVTQNMLSEDGRFVAFTSLASDLVPNDDNNSRDIFLRDLRKGTTQLVSIGPDGHPLPSSSTLLDMSRDGRFVAFNFNQPPTAPNIYVYDAQAGTNTVASILPNGTPTASTEGYLSADGQYLAFRVIGNAPGIFVRELASGRTHAVTNYIPSQLYGISPLGRYVVLFPGTTAGVRLLDWRAGTSIKLPPNGIPSSQFSDDESKVLFYDRSPNLPPGLPPLYVYSLSDGSSNRIGTNVTAAALSGDGSTVVTEESQPGLVTTSQFKLVIHDLQAGEATNIPFVQPDPLFRIHGNPALSRDGRYIAFATHSPVTGGNNGGFNDVFVFDRVLQKLTLVSQTSAGDYGTFGSSSPSISVDGRTIVFESGAADLVANDRNFLPDVFVAHIPITDTDHDGLDDGWEIAHFGNLSAGPQDDPDGDGLSNLAEFLSGTDPKDAQSRFAIQPTPQTSNGKFQIQWQTIPGRSYQLQFRNDLSSGEWTDVGNPVSALGNTLSTETAIAGANGFYRITIAQ